MSEGDDHMPDREGMAAEYVLGTLAHAERLAAEKLIASDPEFAALVTTWTAHLAPLNADVVPVLPPADLRARIEERLFPASIARARHRFWPFVGGLGAVLALGALLIFGPLTPTRPIVTIELRGENQPLVVAAAYDPNRHELVVQRAAGPVAGPGKDYELWVIPAGETPISLGVVRNATRAIALATLPDGATLAITLERSGGAPNGVPEGPVVVAGVIGNG